MNPFIALAVLVFLSPVAFAADPAPSCVEDKINIQKLTQELSQAQLMLQLAQAQFQAATQAQFQEAMRTAGAAKTEQKRLEKLLPKKPEEKK